MTFLLDTHLILWAALDADRLSATARKLLSDPENELFFSVASLWEIAIKSSLNRPDFHVDSRVLRRELLGHDYNELQVTGEHVTAVLDLPAIHKDPFDRILVAQALAEGIALLTSDHRVKKYPGTIRTV